MRIAHIHSKSLWLLVLSVTILGLGQVQATPESNSASVYLFPLDQLATPGKRTISSFIEPKAELARLAVLFQPDCSWCEKQINDLSKLQDQCPENLAVVLIGSNGNKRALKRELRKFNSDFPALYANDTFVRKLGGIKATPVSLFFDNKGLIMAKKRGYMPIKLLKQVISIGSNNQCVFD